MCYLVKKTVRTKCDSFMCNEQVIRPFLNVNLSIYAPQKDLYLRCRLVKFSKILKKKNKLHFEAKLSPTTSGEFCF